jgi:hypothetical protein
VPQADGQHAHRLQQVGATAGRPGGDVMIRTFCNFFPYFRRKK